MSHTSTRVQKTVAVLLMLYFIGTNFAVTGPKCFIFQDALPRGDALGSTAVCHGLAENSGHSVLTTPSVVLPVRQSGPSSRSTAVIVPSRSSECDATWPARMFRGDLGLLLSSSARDCSGMPSATEMVLPPHIWDIYLPDRQWHHDSATSHFHLLLYKKNNNVIDKYQIYNL